MYTVDSLHEAPDRVREGSRVTFSDAGPPAPPGPRGPGVPQALRITITVNGRQLPAEVDPRTLLVHVIRDCWGLSGAKIACDTSQCGACTVLLDGRAVKSCTILAVQADGAVLTTIEGLDEAGVLTNLQQQFRDQHALQCGFCTPGMIMTAVSLVGDGIATDEAAVRRGLAGNICRCTGYQPIVQAVLAAARATGDGAQATAAARLTADSAAPGGDGGGAA